MNFLLRTTQTLVPEQPSVHENNKSLHHPSKSVTTLEGLIAEDPYPRYDTAESRYGQTDDIRCEDGRIASSSTNIGIPTVEKHCDVSEEEGWITIPCKELPDKWNEAPSIHSLQSLDRSFVFPGEQVHILACLSAYEQDVEIITPFKVAAVMGKNGIGRSPKKENGDVMDGKDSHSESSGDHPGGHDVDQNGENPSQEQTDSQKDISAGESLLRMEDQKRKVEKLLQKFKTSHFFVRITEEGDVLWSRKGATETLSDSSDAEDLNPAANESSKDAKRLSQISAIIDKGNFNANVSGGVARNTVQCFALANGDIVVLLQVNVGVGLLKNPIIEVLQFEKFQVENSSFKNQDNVLYGNEDPCGELLTWLLPLDNTLHPPTRPLSPPQLASTSGIGSTSQRSNFSASSGSQLLSFTNFRSYSMSSIPQSTTPPTSHVTTPSPSPSPKPNFELEEWDRFSSNKFAKSKKAGKEGLLSFRGVSLEPDRFSVRCGLEGIYIPGRRWRKKLEIIQPIEIHSFAADCNTDDLLCVQIKNVSPAHIADIVVYIDAITIVLEEAAKGGPPLSIPIASIESGENYSLPNLSLRRGEEHSFILKPAISTWKKFSANERNVSQSSPAKNASSLRISSNVAEGRKDAQASDCYAVMVSCRCNYTESRLFFKQPTTWRPRISRNIMISVASEMSQESTALNSVVSQLPVQVLTLHASNLTSEDLTMTVLAPASFTSPPSVVSLNSSPSSPISSFLGIPEVTGKIHSKALGNSIQLTSDNQKKNGSGETNERSSSVSDVISSTGLGCTHLWLKSRVPLGCVPAQTTATIKIELLPLTDGIITLDTLQIDVKEKGLTYIPEHSLKINATSSISTGIM